MATLSNLALQSLCSTRRANNEQPFCIIKPLNTIFQCSNPQIKNPPRQLRSLRRKNKQLMMVASIPNDCYGDLSSLSKYTIEHFFHAINHKHLDSLEALLSEHCSFGDINMPYQRKEEMMDFLEQLMLAMGENVEIHIEEIKPILDGLDEEAGAIWHLDWNNKPIPLTRGSSAFHFSEGRDRLLIKDVRIIRNESLEKPEASSLVALYATVASLLDTYPGAANILFNLPEHTLLPFFAILTTLFDLYINPDDGILRGPNDIFRRMQEAFNKLFKY